MKDTLINIRISAEDKEKITAYCKAHGITLSTLVRLGIFKIMEENKNG